VKLDGRALALASVLALSVVNGAHLGRAAAQAPPPDPTPGSAAPDPAPTTPPDGAPAPDGGAPAAPTTPAWSPATAADPPVLPPPAHATPGASSAAAAVPPNATPEGDGSEAAAKMRALEARVALDEARLKTLETDVGPLRHLKLQGYVQLQYLVESVNAAASQNLQGGHLPEGIGANSVVAKADGTTTNTNLFRLRRTRLRATYETDLVRVFLQLELLPSGGPASAPGTVARNAEAVGKIHWSKDVLTEVKGGLFEVPFRAELQESSLVRPFIERTWACLNMFPTERDLGVGVKTTALGGRLVTNLGILNGQRLGEPTFVLLPDLNRTKDGFGMASYKLGPVTLSLWGYLGASQRVDPTLLRVKNFARKGVNVGATFDHTFVPSLGGTRAYAELLVAQNMDTGVRYAFAVPAIPSTLTDRVKDLDERGLYIRAEQDLTPWALAGFRYDMYTTDSAIKNNARDTFTGMVGANFTRNLRLINELSYAVDNIHPEGAAAPSKQIYGYTAWLQGSFF
jgi:hypothetical protein